MLSAKTVTRQTGTAPADDTQTSDELEEDLEQSGEESSDVSSEEDGKEMRKLHRGARGRVQRAEANLNGMVEAYAARGVKGLRMKRLAGFALLVSLPSNPHPFVAYGGYLKNATGRKILAQFVRQANALQEVMAPQQVLIVPKKNGRRIRTLEAPSDFKRRWGRQAWAALESVLSRRVLQELVASGAVVLVASGGDEGAAEQGTAAVTGRDTAAAVEQGAAASGGDDGGAGAQEGQAGSPQGWACWTDGLCNGGARPAGKEYKLWAVGSEGECKCGGSCRLFREALDWPTSIALIQWSKDCYSATNTAAAQSKTAARGKLERAKKEQAELAADIDDDDDDDDKEEEEAGDAVGQAAGASGVYDPERLKTAFEQYNMATKAKGLALLRDKLGGTKAQLEQALGSLGLTFKQPTDRQADEMCQVYVRLREEGRTNQEAITEVVTVLTAPGGSWKGDMIRRVLVANNKFTKGASFGMLDGALL
eukprot:XP_001692657.1 Tcr1 transposon ORF1 [Chlamydomonas reinhardtii]